MRKRWTVIVLSTTALGLAAMGSAAESVFFETFDASTVKPDQSILDVPLGWKLVGPNDAAGKNMGNVFLGSGKYGWTGNYLEGRTAAAPNAENSFRAPFPTIVSGRVTLSCRAYASGTTSAGSSIGLCPSQPRYFNRGGGWYSTATGWEFWVGRVHSNEYPVLDGRKFGPYRLHKQPLTGVHDVSVDLSMTVDLDHNKAWGEARWKNADGREERFQATPFDWDSEGGNVSNVLLTIDTRNHHTGIAVDDVRVEGTLPTAKPNPFTQSKHVVLQLNGEKTPVALPAEIKWLSHLRDRGNAQMPYLAYMPEKDRVLMLALCRKPEFSALTASDDHGRTWGPRRWLSVDKDGQPNTGALGLTYLGQGRLLAFPESVSPIWSSADYGQTWQPVESKVPGQELYTWDPLLVVPGINGGSNRLAEGCWRPTGVERESPVGHYSQAYLRFSDDNAQTWSTPTKVPQWLGVNELSMIVAGNGDWVAACRLDNPPWSTCREIPDLYSGLGVSISKDQGKTWSDVKVLYEFGRHHPSMVLLPDGRILMTYVVRLGYPNTPTGFPQVGVEAVISSDNGQTWDMSHRYILARWEGNLRGQDSWFCSVQSTSTVRFPDGAILTAFGTGFSNKPGDDWCKMDVATVRWRIPE